MFENVADLPFKNAAEILNPARTVFNTARGSVLSLGGLSSSELRRLLDEADPLVRAPRVLLAAIERQALVEAIATQIASCIASAALSLWPSWYEAADVDFSICANDPLGREAVKVLARQVSQKIVGVQLSWAEQATLLALRGKFPLIEGFPLFDGVEQLIKAIAPHGLVA